MGDTLVIDVVEQILKRLDVKDIIRCKSVCKSWNFVISSPCFVKEHMNHTYNYDLNNYQLGHRRIVTHSCSYESIESTYYSQSYYLVGSSNGLVCISPKNVRLLIANPSTREVKHLEKLPVTGIYMRDSVCWGFGYDSSIDDYKVIVGIAQGKGRTHFYVLTLKSNIWKFIGQVMYMCGRNSKPGLLLNGSLYWFMRDYQQNRKKIIISFDLSTHEFKEIPLPSYMLSYECDMIKHTLGFFQDCLCIYNRRLPSTSIKWIMKKNYSWELLSSSYDREMGNGYLRALKYDPDKRSCFLCCEDGIRLCNPVDYISAPIYVETLVSPHVKPNYDDMMSVYPRRQKKAKLIKEDPLVPGPGVRVWAIEAVKDIRGLVYELASL